MLASGVLIAGAATTPKPKQMKFACAGNGGVLRYVARAKCKKSEKLVRFDVDNPIEACVKLHGTQDGVRGSLGQLRAARLPAGTTRLSPPADCPAEVQPNEIGIILPGPKKQWFCARSGDRRIRWVSKRSKCKGRELPIWVPQGSPVRTPTDPNPPQPPNNGNKAPTGHDDSATTDKDTSVAIKVLDNDTDPEGDPLSVESVNTNGTTGTVTQNSNGTITYDPAGKFDNLKSGQTAFDNFKYKVQDNHGGKSGETRVDVTIKGKNLAPKAVNDSSSTDEETPKNVAVLGNDTDAEGDPLTVGTIDDTGTVGDVSAGPGNTIAYDPNSQFEDLAVGETRQDTFKYRAKDAGSSSNLATVTMTLSGVNDAPTVNTTSGNASYTEGGAAAPVDSAVAVDDVDGDQISGATVSITSNFNASDGDSLNFTNQNGIAGSYNSGTGVLTLTGNASVGDYQTALRSITYSLTSDNPSGATRTVSFKVKDQHNADSNTDTRDVTVAAANDAPVVTTTAGAPSVNEDAQVTIDGGLTVTDADDTNIESAQVRVSSGFQSGDDLIFVNQNGISGVYNTGTGVLTMTGTASKADYQTALRTIEFRTTNDNPSSPKTIEFKVGDGDADSNAATRNVTVTNVNDAPTVTTSGGSAAFTEGAAAAAVDPSLTVTDPDSANLSGATVSISANFSSADGDSLNFTNTANISGVYNSGTGVLTLSGVDTVANYQAAIRSITFSNTSDNPSTATRTVSFQADDGAAANNLSNVATRDVTVARSNDAPVVTTSAGALTYSEGDPATQIDGALTVTDADDTSLESARVRISTNFESGDDLVFVNTPNISGVYNTGTGVLTLTGTDTVGNYQAALRSVEYRHTGDNPSSGKAVEFKAGDGDTDSNLASKTINITGVNDGPTITTTAAALSYTEGDGPVAADSALTLDDPENDQINSATIQVTGNFSSADDELAFVNTASITGVYNDTTGVLTLTGTDTEANYQAALRSVTYENVNQNPSGSKTLSVKATDNGSPNTDSNTATRTINLANVNDAPVVTTSAGNTSYTEGDPATAVDGSLTVADADDTNIESAQVRISSGFESGDDLVFVNTPNISGVYNTGTGVLTMTGTASVADYQAALRSIEYRHTGDNPATSRTVEFKVNDGDVDSNLATKNLSITRTNDAPTINTSGGSASFTEDTSGAVAVDPNATVSDPDSTQIQGATVAITNNFDSSEDQLVFVDTANITGVYNSGTGVLTLSGTDTVTNYQAALRSVNYNNTDTVAPSPATRTVSFQATDAEGAASNTATRGVTVQPTNDPPVVTPTNGSTSYIEGDPATEIDNGVTVTDQDDTNIEGGQVRISSGFQSGDDLVFVNTPNISGVYNSGNGVLTLTGTSSVADYQTALRSIQYHSTNNNPVASKTVEFKVNDGDVDSNTPTKEIAVTPVNSPPTVDATNTVLPYTENDAATAVDSGLSVTEPESDFLSSASASITANFQSGEDQLTWSDNDPLGDTIVLGAGSTNQTIVLVGGGTAAQFEAALRAVRYQNTSEAPSTLNRTVTFAASDVPGATGTDTRTISVASVDDPPIAVNDPGGTVTLAQTTVLEDALATSIPVLNNDTDVDGGPKTIFSASDPANGTVVITGGGTGLTYHPDANYCNSPDATASATPDTFTYRLNDAAGSTATVSMTVTCVNDAPVAGDETFNATNSAVGNTTLNVNDTATHGGAPDGRPATPDPTDTSPVTDRPHKEISGDILGNDTDVDSNNNAATVTPGTFATNDGGTVTIQSDGDFNFEPAPSTSCTDTSDFFDYTVQDNDSLDPKTDTGRVTIAISGCVWYVNNNDAQGNSGTSEKPFDTLAQAQTASGNNQTTFVYDGDDNTTGYNTGFTMNTGERLLSEAADLTIGSDTLHSADAANKASLTNNNADVVTLAGGATVKGFNIDPQGTGGGVFGTGLGATTVTLDDLNVADNGTKGTQPGLELDTNTGTTTNVSNLTVNNGDGSSATTGDEGVKLNATGTVNFASSGTISLTTNGAKALDATAGAGTTSLGSASTFDDITTTNSGNGGVLLQGTTGSGTAFGDGSGNDLQLTTVSGAPAAFSVQTAGSFSVPSAGQSDVSATGGPAVDVVSSSGSTMPFDSVSSTNSANDGINIDTIGTGTFSATSGSVGGEAGIGFDLSGGSGAITYPGTFNNGTGSLVAEITGRTGGVVSLSGSMNDTNDAGGGVNIANNTGGSTVFSGATKQYNTGASDAVTFSNSDGHTFVLSGGGSDIDTTSGNGINAVTSGTFQVSGSGNTLDSTALSATNRGLNVSDTDFAASDVTFDHINTSGGANGIRLNNTGTAGNLAVTGTGGTCALGNTAGCSGGTIQNATGSDDSGTSPVGTGIALKSTRDTSLTRVRITNNSNYGIRGDSVPGGFSLSNSVIDGFEGTEAPASAGSPFSEAAIRFTELTGSANAISNSGIQGGASDNVAVINTSGTLNRLTMQSDTFGNNSNTQGNRSIDIVGSGTATTNVTVDSSAFTASRSHHFGFDQSGSGGDVVFTNNTMSNNRPATGANAQASGAGNVKLTSGGNAAVTLNVASNTMTGADGNAMLYVHDGSSSLTGTVNSNTIGNAGVTDSGSIEGDGIQLNSASGTAGSNVSLAITNNQIRQYNNFGIELASGSSGLASEAGNISATVTGNTISNPGTNVNVSSIFQGLQLNTATVDGQSFNWCLNAKSNSMVGSGRNGGTDFRLRQRFDTSVRLPGYGGTAFDTTAVTNFIANQNDAAPLDPSANAPVPTGAALTDAPSGGQGFVGGAACASG